MAGASPRPSPGDQTATATPPPRVVGVDFSGAADAGRRIWIARAEPHADGLRVQALLPAAALPGDAVARAPALAALVAWLRGLGAAAVGLDFPFGVHHSLVPEPTLRAFVAGFAARYPDPQSLRTACAATGGERALKRRCDVEARTPFAPHNLRVYRQTWHGIADVLAPLCAGGARLLPQQAPERDRLWLLETCPASALKDAGLYRPYKGTMRAHRQARGAILAHLRAHGVSVPGDMRTAVLRDTGGDSLDALLCAWITWRAVRDPAALRPPLAPEHHVEGYVYR